MAEKSNRLTKEYTASLPIIKYNGSITLIQNERELEALLKNLPEDLTVGFDTETKPSFKKGERHSIALVQIALPDTVLLVRINRLGIPSLLIKLFEDPAVRKVGIAVNEDLNKLLELAFFQPVGFVDLSALAREKGIVQIGLRGLAARYLRGRISKSEQTSNWERKNLTERQQIYAATDAWACLMIYPHIMEDSCDYHELT